MRSIENMIELVQNEIAKMGDEGLKATNIDMIHKLVDILKDLRTAKAMEDDYPVHESKYITDGVNAMKMSADDAYAKYVDTKKEYRHSQNMDCKTKMMDAIEEYMSTLSEKLEDMMNDSDCVEERQTIQRYLQKIK